MGNLKKPHWIARCISGTGLVWSLLGGGIAVPQDNYGYNEAERMLSLNTAELRDQLTYGLRVAFPEQQVFVDQVVAKVEAGELSRAMVNVVYVWAKKRKPNIPFPYFEYVMRLLAEKRGISFE